MGIGEAKGYGHAPTRANFSSGNPAGISSRVGFRGGMGSMRPLARRRHHLGGSARRGGVDLAERAPEVGLVHVRDQLVHQPTRAPAGDVEARGRCARPPGARRRPRGSPAPGPRARRGRAAGPPPRCSDRGQLVDDVGRVVLAEVGQARAGDGGAGQVGQGDAGAHLVAEPALDVGAAGGGELVREPPLVAERGVLEELLAVAGPQFEVHHAGASPPPGPGCPTGPRRASAPAGSPGGCRRGAWPGAPRGRAPGCAAARSGEARPGRPPRATAVPGSRAQPAA